MLMIIALISGVTILIVEGLSHGIFGFTRVLLPVAYGGAAALNYIIMTYSPIRFVFRGERAPVSLRWLELTVMVQHGS